MLLISKYHIEIMITNRIYKSLAFYIFKNTTTNGSVITDEIASPTLAGISQNRLTFHSPANHFFEILSLPNICF